MACSLRLLLVLFFVLENWIGAFVHLLYRAYIRPRHHLEVRVLIFIVYRLNVGVAHTARCKCWRRRRTAPKSSSNRLASLKTISEVCSHHFKIKIIKFCHSHRLELLILWLYVLNPVVSIMMPSMTYIFLIFSLAQLEQSFSSWCVADASEAASFHLIFDLFDLLGLSLCSGVHLGSDFEEMDFAMLLTLTLILLKSMVKKIITFKITLRLRLEKTQTTLTRGLAGLPPWLMACQSEFCSPTVPLSKGILFPKTWVVEA